MYTCIFVSLYTRFQHGRGWTQLNWRKKIDKKEITLFINNVNGVNVLSCND